MLTCIIKKSNSFIENMLKKMKKYINSHEKQAKFIQSLMPTEILSKNCSCPKCGAIDRFVPFNSTYSRNVAFVIDNEIINFLVTVSRIQCLSCGGTHSLLPSFIVPYKIMSLPGILTIIKDSYDTTVIKTSKNLNISYQLIYTYISLVLMFFSEVSILNNKNKYYTNFNKEYYLENILDFNNIDFLIAYNNFYKWCFLMTKHRNIIPKNIFVGVSKAPIHNI